MWLAETHYPVGMLSLLSLFRKWFLCWRYILVMISRSLFSLTVNRFSAFPLPISISRISFSILPSRSSSLHVIFLAYLLLCLRCFLYVRFTFCTSRNFVGDGGFPVCCSTRTSSYSSSQSLPTAASHQSDTASCSHSTSHLCTSCPGSPCMVSTCRRVCPGAVVSSTSRQVPSLYRPTAYSLSMGVSDLLSRRRIAEYLVMDVAVQLFQQFRTAESSVHLQEHQGHFPFRCEEGLSSQLRPHAFPYQTEVLCHLA